MPFNRSLTLQNWIINKNVYRKHNFTHIRNLNANYSLSKKRHKFLNTFGFSKPYNNGFMTPQPNFTDSNEIISDLDTEFFARNPSNFAKYNQPKGDHEIINDISTNKIFLLWRLFPNGVPVNRLLSF